MRKKRDREKVFTMKGCSLIRGVHYERFHCTSNYRPIALASIMSKLLEKIILNRISDNLVTNPNQFGFK